MKKIAVIGSINMDMTAKADRIPGKGETIFGRELRYIPGGKGANQAVAAARLGGQVTMFGCVGQDAFGVKLIDNLKKQGVCTDFIRVEESVSSGIAMITVGEDDNAIVVIAGANGLVTKAYLDAVKEQILSHDIIILQNEIPQETTRYAIEMCHKAGKTIIYNPAPACQMEEGILDQISYLTPNEHEVFLVLGQDEETAEKDYLDKLLQKYPNKLIVTVGSKGVKAADEQGVFLTPSIPAHVVDTTGAGDTFNGAFAFALANGKTFREALYLANITAGLSVEKEGAQAGMPTWEAVQNKMKQQ